MIDKDLASSVFAIGLGAKLLVISTSVERVALRFNQPDQEWLGTAHLDDTRRYLDEGHFLRGSMEPKVQAIVRILESGGMKGVVTNPENLGRALRGETGTTFVRD